MSLETGLDMSLERFASCTICYEMLDPLRTQEASSPAKCLQGAATSKSTYGPGIHRRHALRALIMLQTVSLIVQLIYLVARTPGHATCAINISKADKLNPDLQG